MTNVNWILDVNDSYLRKRTFHSCCKLFQQWLQSQYNESECWKYDAPHCLQGHQKRGGDQRQLLHSLQWDGGQEQNGVASGELQVQVQMQGLWGGMANFWPIAWPTSNWRGKLWNFRARKVRNNWVNFFPSRDQREVHWINKVVSRMLCLNSKQWDAHFWGLLDYIYNFY